MDAIDIVQTIVSREPHISAARLTLLDHTARRGVAMEIPQAQDMVDVLLDLRQAREDITTLVNALRDAGTAAWKAKLTNAQTALTLMRELDAADDAAAAARPVQAAVEQTIRAAVTKWWNDADYREPEPTGAWVDTLTNAITGALFSPGLLASPPPRAFVPPPCIANTLTTDPLTGISEIVTCGVADANGGEINSGAGPHGWHCAPHFRAVRRIEYETYFSPPYPTGTSRTA